jgi:RNA polymerase sigma-70 factor (ECF subfamily)
MNISQRANCEGERPKDDNADLDSTMQHANPEEERASKSPVGAFFTTHWSVVLEAGKFDSPAASYALERLCQAYWYPLYAYVLRNGHNPHDAQDLTQAFFARLLERGYLRLADRNQGRFRTFLLSSLKNFLINEWKRGNREKHGGNKEIFSLDQKTAETRLAAEPFAEQPPDSLYDHGWAANLWERALTSLRSEFEQSGKIEAFERLKIFVWGEKSALSYAEIAGQLNVTEGAVKVSVHRMRQRFGELVRAEVAQTVSTPDEAREELRYLISVIRDGLAKSGNPRSCSNGMTQNIHV